MCGETLVPSLDRTGETAETDDRVAARRIDGARGERGVLGGHSRRSVGDGEGGLGRGTEQMDKVGGRGSGRVEERREGELRLPREARLGEVDRVARDGSAGGEGLLEQFDEGRRGRRPKEQRVRAANEVVRSVAALATPRRVDVDGLVRRKALSDELWVCYVVLR